MTAMIEIRQIKPTRAALKKFVNFEIDLYRDNAWYVPPLVFDDINTLSPAKNPAYDFTDTAFFMAYRDGRPVGRVVGIVNKRLNAMHGTRNARFGWLAFEDDPEISSALMAAVEEWARTQGMNKIIGPLGFTDLDREGLLVEGFEELSTMATNYNAPYYQSHLEQIGYRKDSDWVEFLMTVPEAIPEKYDRIAEIVKKKYGLRVLKFSSRKEIKEKYGRALFELINEAYEGLYEYCPLTDRQIESYIAQYLDLLNLNLVTLIVDKADTLVGVGISMPSMSRALQKSRGRLFPFGWYHLIKGLKGKNDRVDLMLVAVKPEYQNKGVNALLFQDLIPQYIRYGFKYAESNPEMETNSKVQNQWDYFERRQHRRRRSYTKDL